METNGFGVERAKEDIKQLIIPRRELTAKDVLLKVLFCGICHSDVHHKNNDWGDSHFPLVPGHESVLQVLELGEAVTKFNIGDIVCVGNLVDSCQHCLSCSKKEEQYCANGGPSWVYNGRERVFPDGSRTLRPEGDRTYGGYSGKIVVQEKFIFRLPDNLDPAKSTPLLCAGITVFNPLKQFCIGKGHKVGIAGIGGLGHLAVKFAKALGVEVVALTTTPNKLDDMKRLGADDAILVDETLKLALEGLDKIDMEKPLTKAEEGAIQVAPIEYRNYFDLIINTLPYSFDVVPYLRMVKGGSGKLHVVGNMNEYLNVKGMNFVFHGKSITSSNIGGTMMTEEMLKFCSDHNIQADIEIINPDYINQAMKRVVNKDVKYRFVIDLRNVE